MCLCSIFWILVVWVKVQVHSVKYFLYLFISYSISYSSLQACYSNLFIKYVVIISSIYSLNTNIDSILLFCATYQSTRSIFTLCFNVKDSKLLSALSTYDYLFAKPIATIPHPHNQVSSERRYQVGLHCVVLKKKVKPCNRVAWPPTPLHTHTHTHLCKTYCDQGALPTERRYSQKPIVGGL